jgi:hypothetical protein
VGVLSAETGDLDDATGARGERFDVARARVALGGRSFAGAFWSRRDGSGEAHTTAGADFSHFFPAEVRLQGFAARDERGEASAGASYASLSKGGERFAFELSLLELEDGFEPAVGLVARPGTRRLVARLDLPWFPAKRSTVRRFVPTLDAVRYEDLAGPGFDQLVAVGFGVDFKSDFGIDTGVLRQREHLTEPFVIYRDVVVPAGSYDRWEAVVEVESDPTRPLHYEGEIAAGGLYGGEHLFGRFRLTWRPTHRFVISPSLLADRVELDHAEFTAWVARLRVGLTPNAKLRFDLLGQYETERRAAGFGVRARYDFREGTEFVIAWDTVESRDPPRPTGRRSVARTERGAVKLTYLVRL